MFSQIWWLEVQDQGPAGSGFLRELSSLDFQVTTISLYASKAFLRWGRMEREQVSSLVSLHIKTRILLDQGPILRTSINLNLKDLISKYSRVGGWGFRLRPLNLEGWATL